MNTFGEFIHNLRISCNLGLREAADLIGIQAPYLSRIEAGRDNPPSITIIHQMAKIYKVPAEDILDQAKDRAAKVYGEEMMDNDALFALFKTMRQLDENEVIDALRKVYGESEEDKVKFAKFMKELQKKKDDGIGPQLSRLTKQDYEEKRLAKLQAEGCGVPSKKEYVCSICGEISDFAKECFEKAHPVQKEITVEDIDFVLKKHGVFEIMGTSAGYEEQRRVELAQAILTALKS